MTAIAELSGALPDLATSGAGFAGWSSRTETAFERPGDLSHSKQDITIPLAFNPPDSTAISPTPPHTVVLEKPAAYSPRVVDALLPPGMTDRQFLAGLDDAVRSTYTISRGAFEAVWRDDRDQPASPSLDHTWVHLPLPQREVILSAIPVVRPPGQPDWDADWHGKTAHNARSRLARETGHTPDEVIAMTPGSALENQIREDVRLSKLLAKVERHERYLGEAREKQVKADQRWADDQYAAVYASKLYEPERAARDTAIAAQDAKVAHILYTDGKPTQGVDFEGYARTVDVGGKRFAAMHQAFDPREAQDLALQAEEAVEAAREARTALTKAQIDGDGFGPALLASGMPIAAFVHGAFGVIDRGTEGIQNPTVRTAVRKAAKVVVGGGLMAAGASLLGGCAVPVTPQHGPTLPPPGGETSMPTLTAAQETGAMIAQTTQGRAFYDALTTHGVDSSACSPDVLGSLVVEKSLPLDVVSSLTTIATDALANTTEPDHLKAMVCDVVPGANGTQTVEFYFSADRDFTGDGTPDIFIPSQAKVLLPAQLIDGVPQVVAPVVEGQPPAGSPVVAPAWSASGGEIPAEIRGLMTVEEQSIRASFTAQNIDPNSVYIHDVFRGSGDDFRMGSGVTNLAQTIAFYPQFDDTTDGFGWRPDLRLIDRPWHWEQVPLPQGVDGKIEVVFDPKSEAPQFVALTADESRMTGWFNNLTGQWLTKDGKELTQTLASTATMTATIPPPVTETPAPSATPEIGPTSCLDKDAVQTVVNSYLELKGKADIMEALQAHVDKYGGVSIMSGRDKTNTYALGMVYENVPILGEFEITLKDGTGYCTVFAVPVTNAQKKVLSVNIFAVFTDATIGGTYSGSLMPYYTEDPSAARKFIAAHLKDGAPVNVGLAFAYDPSRPAGIGAFGYKSRSVLGDIVMNSYVRRFGDDLKKFQEVAGSIIWPDPMKIVESLDPTQEVGLLSSGILEHK